jgi:hypothetical protein
MREFATKVGGLDRNWHVALLGLLPSRVFTLADLGTAFTVPPLMRLIVQTQATETLPLQGIAANEVGLSLSRPPTLLGFHHLVTIHNRSN